jgi:ABC-type antimicrobial peptide transport system permease subunit
MLSRTSVALGLLALVLAALGLGGAIANSVARRQKEFGIRLALGATPKNLVSSGLARALGPVSFGIIAGGCLVLVLARFLRTFLFGLEPSDPFVLLGAALLLLTVSAFAAGVPLIGTVRIQPASALRQE